VPHPNESETYYSFKDIPEDGGTMELIREAEEDIRLGRTISGEELRKKDIPKMKRKKPKQYDKGVLTFEEKMDFSRAEILRDAPWEKNGLKGKGIIRGIALAGSVSENKRRYNRSIEKAHERGAYENVKLFFMHKEGEKDIQNDLWGRTANTYYDPSTKKEYGDALVINHHDTIFNLAEGGADLLANSQEAKCEWKIAKDGWVDVHDIEEILRIATVDRAATNKSLFESKEEEKAEGDDELTIETKEELKEKYPELIKGILQEEKESSATEAKVKSLLEEREQLEKENKELKEQQEKDKEAQKISDSEKFLKSALELSRLNDTIKKRVLTESEGKVLSEEEIQSTIKKYEEICEEAVKDVTTGKVHIPETKADSGNEELGKYCESLVSRMFGVQEEKTKEEVK
jgi:hypothetical protein